jgi:hypothetical protein
MAAEYLVLHAKNEDRVRSFYKKHGFKELPRGTRDISDYTFDACVPAYLKIPRF